MKKHIKIIFLLFAAVLLLSACNPGKQSEQTTAATTESSTNAGTPDLPLPSQFPDLILNSEQVHLVFHTYLQKNETDTTWTINRNGNFIEAKMKRTSKDENYEYIEKGSIFFNLETNEIYYPVSENNTGKYKYEVATLSKKWTWEDILNAFEILMPRDRYAFVDDNYVWLDVYRYQMPVDLLDQYSKENNFDLNHISAEIKTEKAVFSGTTSNGFGSLTVIFREYTVTFPKAERAAEEYSGSFWAGAV